jgi:hypothetical protein
MQFFPEPPALESYLEISPREFTPREIAPGVTLERRTFCGLGLAAFASWFWAPRPSAFESRPIVPNETTLLTEDLERLISQLRPAARQLIASQSPDEEKYIELAIQELQKVTELDTFRYVPGGTGWEMDFQAFVPPILLYQIRMQPNSRIELHDHRHHNGALTVREGDIRVRSFDIFQADNEPRWDVAAGNVPAIGEEFLKSGQAAGLTRVRENIHQIEAGPGGCLMYDLFTNFKPLAQSFSIQWDGQYSDPARKLCQVQWIPPDHSHD